MQKLFKVIFEILVPPIILAWLFLKYPEVFDAIIPWMALAWLWYLTWDLILEGASVKRYFRQALNRIGRMMWFYAFVLGGAISVLYLWAIYRGMISLASEHTHYVASQPVAPPSSPGPAPQPVKPTQAPALSSAAESPKPEISIKLVYPKQFALMIVNTSRVVLREPKYWFALVNLDNRDPSGQPIILPIPTASGDWIHAKDAIGPMSVVSLPTVAPLIKPGDHLFGYIGVTCPDCPEKKLYWVYAIQDRGGWYSQMRNIKGKDKIEVPIPGLLSD